jgi:hypothetical protein
MPDPACPTCGKVGRPIVAVGPTGDDKVVYECPTGHTWKLPVTSRRGTPAPQELSEHDRRCAADALAALITAGEALNAAGDRRLAGTGFDEVDRVIDTVLSAAGIEGVQPALLIDGEAGWMSCATRRTADCAAASTPSKRAMTNGPPELLEAGAHLENQNHLAKGHRDPLEASP